MTPPLLQTRSNGLSEPSAGARSAPLDIHKGIADKRVKKCSRWPENMRLLSNLGELAKGRCKSPNLCDCCAVLSALENSEMLALDALIGEAPAVYLVTSTSLTSMDTRRYRAVVDHLIKAWRRELPSLEYGCIIEFTTGRAGTSGGYRRPHWNWFLKGVTEADVPELLEIVNRVWSGPMRASRKAQYGGAITNSGGLLRYLAMHFQKEDQRPPEGWKGHRLRLSRGYLTKPTPEMRAEARASRRLRRELWKANELGHTGVDAEAVAQAAIVVAESLTWRMAWIEPASGVYRPYITRGAGLTASGGVIMGSREAL